MTRTITFFRLSKLHPNHSSLILAACVGFGLWTIAYDAGELDSALGLLLVVQMFVASTGFTSRAFAGHFDPMLVAGASRPHAAFAHWLVSIGPGVAGWLLLAFAALALGNTGALSAIAGRRAVALLVVSSVAWIAGFRLARGAAGVLWLTVLVAVLLQHNLRALSMSLDQGTHAWLWNIGVVLVCPFLLIGDKPYVSSSVLSAAALISVSALFIVFTRTTSLNVVLAERA